MFSPTLVSDSQNLLLALRTRFAQAVPLLASKLDAYQ